MDRRIVIIGGGIAGLSCLEGLLLDYSEEKPQFQSIVLVSDCRLVKKTVKYESRGRNLEEFKVEENHFHSFLEELNPPLNLSIKFVVGKVRCIDCLAKSLTISIIDEPDETLNYEALCICTGSKPRELDFPSRYSHDQLKERIFVIKDITTVSSLQRKLTDCKHLAIIGNGGISLELVGKVKNCHKTWIIRDESIGLPFFDSGASKFLLKQSGGAQESRDLGNSTIFEAQEYSNSHENQAARTYGPALGPFWLQSLQLNGSSCDENLEVIYQDDVQDIKYLENQRQCQLSLFTRKGRQINCDLVALAIGVSPNVPKVDGGDLEISNIDGGILVDTRMHTSCPDIYAAGDVISCDKWPTSELWFQKRLWTQARQMGHYAGRCITCHLSGQDPNLYFNFECFTHCTRFFGQRLVLLGQYNGQKLEDGDSKAYEVLARVVEGKDYIKLLLKNGRIIGAVLVGDTNLEETVENLIYDRIDVSLYKERLLDGSVDIEDFFD